MLIEISPKQTLRSQSTAQWFQWFMRAKAGEVNFTYRGSYNGTILHSFGNASFTEDVLMAGTTHVAVGFLDLGQLSCAKLLPASGDQRLSADKQLRWIGYDSSAYSVAKSYVRSAT